jgi:hypothetical protein
MSSLSYVRDVCEWANADASLLFFRCHQQHNYARVVILIFNVTSWDDTAEISTHELL